MLVIFKEIRFLIGIFVSAVMSLQIRYTCVIMFVYLHMFGARRWI